MFGAVPGICDQNRGTEQRRRCPVPFSKAKQPECNCCSPENVLGNRGFGTEIEVSDPSGSLSLHSVASHRMFEYLVLMYQEDIQQYCHHMLTSLGGQRVSLFRHSGFDDLKQEINLGSTQFNCLFF